VTILCFEAHHADGRVWAIRHRGKWTRWRAVVIQGVTVDTDYRGPKARQPKAALAMWGPVQVIGDRRRGGIAVIQPALSARRSRRTLPRTRALGDIPTKARVSIAAPGAS